MNNKKRVMSANFINNVASLLGKKMNNFVIVKHYGTYSIDSEDARNVMISYDNIEISYAHFANNEMVGSYEPFLTVIKNCYIKYYNDISIDEYLKRFDIYELHKPFFSSYIDGGECERYESFILDEIEYEKEMMLYAVVNTIIDLSKEHPMVIMIDNAHMMPRSTIKVLKGLFDNPDNKNIGILAAYNDLKHVASVNKDEWSGFVKKISTKGYLLEGGTEEDKDETDSSEFIFESKRAYEYLNILKTMYYTVELEQADYYLQKIHKKLTSEKMNIDAGCKFELFKLYTKVLINSEDFTTAILICDNLKEMSEQYMEPRYEYDYCMLYSYTQMYSGKTEQAKKYATKCKELAATLKDDMALFEAEMLKYMIAMSGWHNIYFVVKNIEIDKEFIEKTEKYQYYNHLAHMYIYGYHNDFSEYQDAKTTKDIDLKMTKYREGIDIAKRIGNTCLILKAYRKITMITSSIGNFNITEHYYEKYINILGDSDEKELAEVKNGQGYINCSSRNFKKAHECYLTSLKIFMKLGDIKLVGETLYNMTINAILAEDYANAYEYGKICIRIIKKMSFNDLRVCNIAKIYGLLALTSARLSYEYDTIFFLNTNRKFLDHIINNCTYKDEDNIYRAFKGNDDELFLQYFVNGILAARDEDYTKALKYYHTSEKHCLNSEGNLFFSYVQLRVAMAEAYRALGDTENESKMLDMACDYAEKKRYTEQLQILNKMRKTGKYEQDKAELNIDKNTLEQIDILIEKASIIMQNETMTNQIEFISAWQNIIEINNKTEEDLIKTAAISFSLNFNIDTFLYIKFYENSAKIVYSDGSVNLTKNDLNILKEYFEQSKSGFVTAKIDKNYEDYKKILEIFGIDVVCSMVCNPFFKNEKLDSLFISCIYMKTNWNVESSKYLLNESDVNIFNLVLRQLLIAIDKIKNINEIKHINEALKKSSYTDYLTGLKNRNGFYESIGEIVGDASRNGKMLTLSLMYIDLDNFKYYNDNFGHDVGDLVLKEVAQILNYAAGKKGFAIRYGGDEFLIVLENVGKDEAMATARMVLDMLLSKNGYINEISTFLGKKVIINREKRLTCSIGVSSRENVTCDEDIAKLLKLADSSLYDIKNTTKNAVKYCE